MLTVGTAVAAKFVANQVKHRRQKWLIYVAIF